MRDLVIFLAVAGVCVWTLRRPWIGILAWTLISLGSPHIAFGYSAQSWPVALAVAVSTLLGLVLTKDKQNPMVGAPVWWLLAFVVWISIALPLSLYFDDSVPLWERSIKIFMMIFVALALLNDRRKLHVFIWINVVAIGYYGVKGGVFTVVTGGNYIVWGPGGFIEGNNEMALAAITVIPLMRYLQMQMTDRRASLAMTGAISLCAVAALGTYSRGAFLGLAAMFALFWVKGRNKFAWAVLLVAVAAIGLPLMPEQWWTRMDTINTYSSDGSAMGRINAWWTAFYLAEDRFFGGGFMSWMPSVFERYAPNPEDVHAAHSIYFQVMGEQGFGGLFLFLAIGASTWLTASRLIRAGQAHSTRRWAEDLGQMVHVSMIGYGVTGAFLSLAYYDLPYNVMVMAVLADRFVRREPVTAAAAGPIAAAVSARPAPTATHGAVGRGP